MILPIVLIVCAAWGALFLLVHLTLLIAAMIHRGSAEEFASTVLYRTVKPVGLVIHYPLFVAWVQYRRTRRLFLAYRLVRKILALTDIRQLPREAQEQFMARIENNEEPRTVVLDFLKRAREEREKAQVK